MKKSLFAGLTILDAGEPLSEDNGAFTGVDRERTDRLLRIGAKTHRHTGLNGLNNPAAAPSATVIASAGTIASDLAISLGYTLEDADGGETMISPVAVVSSAPPLAAPQFVPSAAADYTAGELLVNTYFYALTFTDGEGGETALGPSVSVERAPGFEKARVQLSHLNHEMAEVGAVGWRLYRAVGGGTFNLLATGDASESTFTDDGTHSLDCSTHPPAGELNTTNGISSLLVVLPSGVQTGAEFINVYATVTGDFGGGSLLEQFPVSSAGATAWFPSLELDESSPPPVNLSIGGAHQIDPDTELLDWHWKRPVASSAALGSGEKGDVRLATDSGRLYAVLAPSASAASPVEWVRVGSAASLTASAASGNPGAVLDVSKLVFVGSGASASIKDLGGGGAQVTIAVPQGGTPLTVFGSGSAVAGAETANTGKLEFIGSGGVNVKESSPGGGTAKVIVEGMGAALRDQGMAVMVLKTSEKGAARPTWAKQVTWFCKEKPTNMAEFDIWIEEGP